MIRASAVRSSEPSRAVSIEPAVSKAMIELTSPSDIDPLSLQMEPTVSIEFRGVLKQARVPANIMDKCISRATSLVTLNSVSA